MNIEVLIYSYLVICAAMIMFNVVCIFVFKQNEIKIANDSEEFEKIIQRQIKSGKVDNEHKKYLVRKLKNEKYLLAFDQTLEKLYVDDPEGVKKYFKQLVFTFVELTKIYSKKDEIKATFFPYVIKKYQLFNGEKISSVNDAIYSLLRSKSVYCRENALYAIYSIGFCDNVIKALKIIDNGDNVHNQKLITDGLLSFSGDKSELDKALWQNLNKFSLQTKVAILDYFRFSNAYYPEPMLELLCDKTQDNEIRYSAIRYFGKYPYEAAYNQLCEFVNSEGYNWEYSAISALSLASYQSLETIDLLKSKLSDKNWYVRYNSSLALKNMGLGYDDLKDIIEGNDKFASDIVKYQIDKENLKEMEMKKANV